VTIGFQVGALIQVRDGQDVGPGEVLAHPGRRPEDARHHRRSAARGRAVRSPHAQGQGRAGRETGTVSFGKETKGKIRLQITDPDGKVWEELVPKEKNMLVHEGQVVNKGESIVDGPADPQDILRLLGIEELARYIVDEVQDVYRLQGVKINDKHIEVIVRQMLRRVVVENPGESSYIAGEQVERSKSSTPTRRCRPRARSGHLLQRAAGHHQGLAVHRLFISAASFQETTRVLTEAAIMGKRDELRA
jgi:DNA-directed RNA polymerase subunit beta'